MTKRMWMTCVIVLFMTAVPTAKTYANISEAAVLFLRIASGARPAGMGEAFVALADDATATHWNPGGLGRYPLSDLWMDVPLPTGYQVADFAVVENDVPENNYMQYDLWILTKARRASFVSGLMKNPAVTPYEATGDVYSFMLNIDGHTSGPFSMTPGKVFTTAEQLVAEFQGMIDRDEVLSDIGANVEFEKTGDSGRLKVTSGTDGPTSRVVITVAAGTLPDFLAQGRPVARRSGSVLRATPPSPYSGVSGNDGLWVTGDSYEPDASENLVDLVRSRTGLPDGEELDRRVAQVAELNLYVPTDSLRSFWSTIRNLPDAVIPDSLSSEFQKLVDAHAVLNTDPDRLQSLLDEMTDVVKDGAVSEDAIFRLQVLVRRAMVPFLPEELDFPFALNLPGEVTSITSRDRVLYLGTTRGVLMYSDGRSLALNDTTAGPAAGMIHDVAVTPSGVIWVATDEGVSRYSSTWKHYGFTEAFMSKTGADRVFVQGEKSVFAYGDGVLYRFDAEQEQWFNHYTYVSTIGDRLEDLPGKLLRIKDPQQAKAYADSLVRYGVGSTGELEAGTIVRVPYFLAYRGHVSAVAVTAKKTLWIGTDRGLTSISRDGRAKRHGYTDEAIEVATTVIDVARKFVGVDREDAAKRLAERIKLDNFIEGDMIAAGRVVEVFSGVTGSKILDIRTDGNSVLAGTEYGTVENTGKNSWYRYTHNDLQKREVQVIEDRGKVRWFASEDRIVLNAQADRMATLMHVQWLKALAPDLYYEYIGTVMPLKGLGTVGANVTFLSLGTQERTDANAISTGQFSSFDIAGTVSYGTRVTGSLAMGVSAKIIYSHLSAAGAGDELGSGTSTGLGIDLGMIWNTPFRRLDLGAAITNLGPKMAYIDANQADPLPRNLAVGFAYRLFNSPYNRLTLIGDINKDLIGLSDDLNSQLDEAIFNMGMEYQYGSFIAIRTGYIYDRQGDIKKPTIGFGLQYRSVLFDFAYIPSSQSPHPLDNTTRLSLSLRW